jgi:hypothetical protein
MTMTVGELIEYLSDFDPEAEVRLAQQPRWAFEYSVGEVAGVELDEGFVVYIGEGSQLAYLAGAAQEALGWRES